MTDTSPRPCGAQLEDGYYEGARCMRLDCDGDPHRTGDGLQWRDVCLGCGKAVPKCVCEQYEQARERGVERFLATVGGDEG